MIDVNVGAFRRKRGDVKSVKEASNAWVLPFCQMYVTPRHLSADNHRRDSLTFRDWRQSWQTGHSGAWLVYAYVVLITAVISVHDIILARWPVNWVTAHPSAASASVPTSHVSVFIKTFQL